MSKRQRVSLRKKPQVKPLCTGFPKMVATLYLDNGTLNKFPEEECCLHCAEGKRLCFRSYCLTKAERLLQLYCFLFPAVRCLNVIKNEGETLLKVKGRSDASERFFVLGDELFCYKSKYKWEKDMADSKITNTRKSRSHGLACFSGMLWCSTVTCMAKYNCVSLFTPLIQFIVCMCMCISAFSKLKCAFIQLNVLHNTPLSLTNIKL